MLNWGGLAGIIVFYLLILSVGLWAAWRRRKSGGGSDEVILAGRNIGLVVGILSMSATWVGGGYINGSAQETFSSGLVWTQAPFAYSISLVLGGLLFAKKMRAAGYTTMLDPLQERLGAKMGAILFLPALFGDLLYGAAVLNALGSTINVILDLDSLIANGDDWSIVISAAIAVFYTLFGGLLSVVYTDLIQLFCMVLGLWITVPFALKHKAFTTLDTHSNNWIGTLEARKGGLWFDLTMLMLLGGIPWQSYLQRVLASKSPQRAQILSCVAGVGSFILAIPAIIIGAIAKGTQWELTEYGHKPEEDETRFVLPLVMQYLTPTWVAFVGLGAVSAAVMSSADSSVLAVSTQFARNVYKNLFRPKASDREIVIVVRIGILVAATIATVIAIKVKSIYGLLILCSDLIFVILFPQLLAVVHLKTFINTYGSFAGVIVGFVLRVAGGEPYLGLKPGIKYWFYDDNDGQLFPFRTFSMLCSLATLIAVSTFIQHLFTRGFIPERYDFVGCCVPHAERANLKDKTEQQRRDSTDGIDNPGVKIVENTKL